MTKRNLGFTMIELLIVIAVLGILAVAVLSAINPIEQINRGRDTGSRSDAEQLLSAIERYYTTQQVYPWEDPAVSSRVPALPWQIVDDTWESATGKTVLSVLSSGGAAELKESYVTRLNNTPEDYKLHAYFSGTEEESVYVCFLARSGSFKTEAGTRCDEGLPDDLLPVVEAIICDEDAPYICLP